MRFSQKALGFNELKHKFKYGFIWKGNDKINKKSALVHDTKNFIAVPSQLRSLCQPVCESLKHEPGKMFSMALTLQSSMEKNLNSKNGPHF